MSTPVDAAEELVVWHSWRGDEKAAIDRAAEAFGASHGVEVTCVAIPFGGFDAKVETAVPRGNGPDVWIAGHSPIGRWIPMGLLVPTAPEGDALPSAAAALVV